MNENMIVVAHQHPVTVHTLVTALAAAGYEAAGALTFRDAMSLVADCRPGVLVVNLELGAFNGLHLAVRCASDFPWTRIVLIGPANAALEDEARRLGVSAYVARPASPESIVEHALAVMAAPPPAPLAPVAVTHA
jgi:ActR/RegA family two-component response regulator